MIIEIDPQTRAELIEATVNAVRQMAGPWLDRRGAAAYAQCSLSELDRAANAGAFKRYQRAGTPLFRKDEIDAALSEGRWPGRAGRIVKGTFVPDVPPGETDRRVKHLLTHGSAT